MLTLKHPVELDALELEHAPYQQTSLELVRLGCLLAVFLPFELSVQLLGQLCGIGISDDTVWHWVQQFGRQAMNQLETELKQLATGIEPMVEPLAPTLIESCWS